MHRQLSATNVRRFSFGLVSTSILMLFCTLQSGFSQSTSGSIAGAVVDQQQASVQDASVTVKDVAKGFTQTNKTDSQGRFVFPQLSPGAYTLTVEASGFKRTERTAIDLVANDKVALGNITVEVGSAVDTVTVTVEATVLQAESAERSYAIQGEALRRRV